MLKQGTFEDFKQSTATNYVEWGTGLNFDQYLEREIVSKKYVNGHRAWLLVNKDNQDEVYASCETYSNESIYAFKGQDKVYKGISESVASVFVELKHRGKGYSTQLMKQLYSKFQEEGRAFCDLYSDVDPKVYSKCGWNVYPATSLIIDLTDNEKNSKIISNNEEYKKLDESSSDITEQNISMVLDKEIQDTKKRLLQFVNSDSNTHSFAYCKIFTVAEFFWEISQSKVYSTYLNVKTPTKFGHVIFNKDKTAIKSYIIWSIDFRSSELKLLKLVAGSEIEFKYLIKKSFEYSKEYNLKSIYAWWDQSTSQFNKEFVESIGYSMVNRNDSIPMVCSWIKDSNNQLLDQKTGIWVNIEKFGWV